MIKGIYLITGLLNYSSAEARLFRRMLIALRSLGHLLAFICCRLLADQRFVKTATKNKIKKERKGNSVLVLTGNLPGTWLSVRVKTRVLAERPSLQARRLASPVRLHFLSLSDQLPERVSYYPILQTGSLRLRGEAAALPHICHLQRWS